MRKLILLLIVAGVVWGGYYSMHLPPGPLILTGIVTTESVIVGPQVGGQIGTERAVDVDAREIRWRRSIGVAGRHGKLNGDGGAAALN